MKVRRLPDLNVPRTGHAAFCVNGEVTVVGGHTSGFVPTQTAEYYAGGKWHLMSTVYTHDDGLYLPLSSGKVLLAGGHHEPLGIGQTFRVEMYHPATHTFEGFGCLEQKRSMAQYDALLPEKLEEIRQKEEYLMLVEEDMRKLEGEKGIIAFERERAVEKRMFLGKFSAFVVVAPVAPPTPAPAPAPAPPGFMPPPQSPMPGNAPNPPEEDSELQLLPIMFTESEGAM